MEKHMHPDNLERYSFLWSEVRLIIAALALFMGGYPPLLTIAPEARGLLTLAWIISGVAAGYLLYRWIKNDKKLFEKKDTKDMIAFLISIVSGINLGLAGLANSNIGMSIASGKGVFIVVGILYLLAAYHLYMRWKASHQKLF